MTAGVIGIGAPVVLAIVTAWPGGILDGGLRTAIEQSRGLAADIDAMLPTLSVIVDRTPGARTAPTTPGTPPLLLAPRPYQPRLSLDLGVPGTNLRDLSPWASSPGGHPIAGQYVAYDRLADGSSAALKPYEASVAITLDGVRIVPVASDSIRGWWITEIQAIPPG